MPLTVTSKIVAEELLALWIHLTRDSGSQLFQLLEQLDLGLTQLKTLDRLEACGCEPTVKELAELLGLSVPGTSRNVEGLLQRGYLERREDAHDRRMKRLRLTDAGRDVLSRVFTARLAGLESWAATLTDEQRDALHAALVPLTEGLPR
ncbi:MAG TPA: MarR family transcriptional regulator [Solirubrobacteraceae bacterium]